MHLRGPYSNWGIQRWERNLAPQLARFLEAILTCSRWLCINSQLGMLDVQFAPSLVQPLPWLFFPQHLFTASFITCGFMFPWGLLKALQKSLNITVFLLGFLHVVPNCSLGRQFSFWHLYGTKHSRVLGCD